MCSLLKRRCWVLDLILASGNAHKASEFATLFAGKINVKPAPNSIDVIEDGVTYQENALIKARAYYEKFSAPALADDSGLTIEALPDILGVQSARFMPEAAEYQKKCEEILRRLNEASPQQRQAHFTCVLCFYLSPTEVFFFEGKVHGVIGESYRGDGGFGYDPIFVPTRSENDGKTLAELPIWKNENSHRARAAVSAMSFFKNRDFGAR
jgi:XTP/dITP diphosphohydrolase